MNHSLKIVGHHHLLVKMVDQEDQAGMVMLGDLHILILVKRVDQALLVTLEGHHIPILVKRVDQAALVMLEGHSRLLVTMEDPQQQAMMVD